NIASMIEYHVEKRAEVTVAAIPTPRKHAVEFGVIEADQNDRIVAFHEKNPDAPSIPGKTFPPGSPATGACSPTTSRPTAPRANRPSPLRTGATWGPSTPITTPIWTCATSAPPSTCTTGSGR